MTQKALNVVFMGTPDFAASALQALIGSHHKVVCVYSQPPRPKGRGQHLQKSPVHELAENAGIPVRTPLSLKKDEQARHDFIALNADIAVVAAYGLILPAPVLNAPRYGCINIHASLLPRWRGASPIQHAILSGDSESGITIMRMEEGLDTGPMIERQSVPILPDTTAPLLHDALAALGAEMIVPALDRIAARDGIDATPQDDALTCYAPLLKKEDGRIDWSQPAAQIDRQVRALNPWPGVYTINHTGQRLKILSAIPGTGTGAPGTVLDKTGAIACGAGTLILQRVQPDNGKPMDFAAALNGGYLEIGKTLS